MYFDFNHSYTKVTYKQSVHAVFYIEDIHIWYIIYNQKIIRMNRVHVRYIVFV